MKINIVFFMLAIICFIGFVGCLIWYLLDKKQSNTKVPIKWTIESAKKFLEENNMDIQKSSNETASKAVKDEVPSKNTHTSATSQAKEKSTNETLKTSKDVKASSSTQNASSTQNVKKATTNKSQTTKTSSEASKKTTK